MHNYLKSLTYDPKVEPETGAGPAGPRRGVARVRLAYGRACDVEHDDRSMRVDLPIEDGGGATGPDPGQLMRSSLGASLLLGYRFWAQRRGVPLDDVTLEVACEFDPPAPAETEPDAAATWQRIRFEVTVTSSAGPAELQALVDVTHRHSPMLALLSERVEREVRLHIVRPG